MKNCNQNPFPTSESGWRLLSVNNEIKVPFSNPQVDTIIPGHHSCQSTEGKTRVPWLISPNSVPLSTLTLDDIATAMERRGQRSHQRREVLIWATVSLLGYRCPAIHHCRDLSWISLRMDPVQVCLRGPSVCVPANASHWRLCCWLPPFLPPLNSGTDRGGKRARLLPHWQSFS